MVLAALRQADKHYAGVTVLDGVGLELRAGARTALIGRNGSGKSTILRLLAGDEAPDAGEAWRRDGVVVARLHQDPDFEAGADIQQVCEQAFRDLDAMEARLQTLEADGLDDPERYAAWETLHETFERRGGYQRRARRDAVLHALGFRGREHDPVAPLSGGEKTRLALARLLMEAPDVLLLDEPTNHLDVVMRAWLEGFLARYRGAALIVSHDRDFLDGACDRTAEIARGRLLERPGNPSRFRQEQAEQERIEARTRSNQRKEEDRLASSAAQMRKWAGQNAKLMRRAKAIETRLERHRDAMLDEPERNESTVRFTFEEGSGGHTVLNARHLSKSADGRTLFRDVHLTIRAGERIALTGPNGAGKTTLLRLLLGETASDDPRARVDVGAKVRVGYYDQELTGLDPDSTLLAELVRLVGDRQAHDLLGRFLFPFRAQEKVIRDLSGGERARTALLKLTLNPHDLLVLDEPTNHLDVEMIEALEAALDVYRGTLVIVSHDRRFVRGLATRVWEVRDGRFEDYPGDWDYYLRKSEGVRGETPAGEEGHGPTEAAGAHRKAPHAHEARGTTAATDAQDGQGAQDGQAAQDALRAGGAPSSGSLDPRYAELSPWRLEREIEGLEAEAEAAERSVSELVAALARPSDHDASDLAELGRAHAHAEARLQAALDAWAEAERTLGAKRR